MKPYEHAISSAKHFGGDPYDYLSIHQLMDSSKSVMADVRHRALTHNSFFIGPDGILEKIFGVNITNSENTQVSVRAIAEKHILEDLGHIPSLQDWFSSMKIEDWMVPDRTMPPSIQPQLEAEAKSKKLEDIAEALRRAKENQQPKTQPGIGEPWPRPPYPYAVPPNPYIGPLMAPLVTD